MHSVWIYEYHNICRRCNVRRREAIEVTGRVLLELTCRIGEVKNDAACTKNGGGNALPKSGQRHTRQVYDAFCVSPRVGVSCAVSNICTYCSYPYFMNSGLMYSRKFLYTGKRAAYSFFIDGTKFIQKVIHIRWRRKAGTTWGRPCSLRIDSRCPLGFQTACHLTDTEPSVFPHW